MRLIAGAVGAALVLAVALVALHLDASSATSVAATPAPAETPRPFVTADPRDTSRVDVALERGRLPLGERADRRRIAVHGLVLPIAGASLPSDPDLLPNAPRDFRAGWHEGIDFPARVGTPVRAAAAGSVVRIDRDFVDWDAATRDAALEAARRLGYTPAATLDRVRGRQVWIDHGNGVVTRYAHLSAVADLAVGDAIAAGAVVGKVGSSGYPEGGPHLHLEVRIGSSYLGDGLTGDALVAAVRAAFE